MKKTKKCGCVPAQVVIIGLCAAMALGQETTIRPTPQEVESLLVMTVTDFRKQFGHNGGPTKPVNGWIAYNIMHVDREKAKAELSSTSRPAEKVHIYQCGNNAGIQQETASNFAPLADIYSYWAFRYTSKDKPAEDELLWAGLDNPFLNHVRKMRQICDTTPIVAQLHSIVAGRPMLLEEVQWQFIAALGCGYRGVLWPKNYKVAWGDDVKQIEERIRRHGRFLAKAKPVNWAKADNDQAISALACNGHLFVFLLNGAYMTLGADGKSVLVPLEKTLCEGTVAITLPAGLKIRRGRTLLGEKTLHLATEGSRTKVEYSFGTGGEMLIFTLTGKIEPAATQPTTQPAATEPATAENKQ